ncbi:MAG TPA: hypothetical protein VGK19_04145 [Capsulimonadaceae bacterium]|jgi:hypothetical protein
MKRPNIVRPFVAVAALLFASLQVHAAGTNLIREIAKNDTPIVIVASGPAEMGDAQALQSQILMHPDNKHSQNDCRVYSISDAQRDGVLSRPVNSQTVISLMQFDQVPDQTSLLLPTNRMQLALAYKSVIDVRLTNDKAGHLAFSAALVAPDAERVRRLVRVLNDRAADDYKTLPFSALYTSNKLAVYTAAVEKDEIGVWGDVNKPDTWDYIEWRAIGSDSAMSSEATPVYLVDRSESGQPAVLGAAPSPTALIVTKTQLRDGRPAVVLSAPSESLLVALADKYPTVASIPEGGVRSEAIDLRTAKRSVILVTGANTAARRVVRGELISRLQLDAHAQVADVTTIYKHDLSLDAIQDEYNKAVQAGKQPLTRYVWLFDISDVSGGTQYAALRNRISPDAPRYWREEPSEPTRYKGSTKMADDEWDKARKDYDDKHRFWQRQRDEYLDVVNNYLPVTWQVGVNASDTAHIAGALQLIDLANPGSSPWRKDVESSQTASRSQSSDLITVSGYRTAPRTIVTPPALSGAPDDLLSKAAGDAVGQAVRALSQRAWF